MRIHGSLGRVDMDPAGGSTVAPIVGLNNWTLDQKRDRQRVTAFGDTNHQYVQGLPDITGSLSGFYDSDENLVLFDAAAGDAAVTLHLIPNRLAETERWAGLAYLDAGVRVNGDGAVTISGSFAAAGNWTRPVATP